MAKKEKHCDPDGDDTDGLAGSDIGDGAPLQPEELEDQLPYGAAGGAVGDTPAEGRAVGGHVYRHH